MKKFLINLCLVLAVFVQLGDNFVINTDKIIYITATSKNKTKIVYGVQLRSSYANISSSFIVNMTLKDVLHKIERAQLKGQVINNLLDSIQEQIDDK